eukprot:COSAG02_NODE_56909_length_283_cov_0.766304_2_plen_40_part_01
MTLMPRCLLQIHVKSRRARLAQRLECRRVFTVADPIGASA